MAIQGGPDGLKLTSRLWKRWAALKTERASWDPHWKELSNRILPRNSRFFITDRNKGGKRHNAIYDNAATRASRILAAGMMAGMTSPARPWFRLSLEDRALLKRAPVQVWLSDVTRDMLRIFAVSNTYRALHSLYEELGVFGTGVSIVQPHFETVIRHTPLTTGEYALSANADGEIDTMYREFQKPVHAVVREFGLNNVSDATRRLYENGDYDQWVTIVHAVEPRLDRNIAKLDPQNMAFRSVYFEHELQGRDKFLRESGYRRFPALAPRWAVYGSDIYGTSPAMDALGDINQLQHEQLRKAQGIDYQTKPPLGLPTGLKGQEVDTLPGGVSYINSDTGGSRALWEARLDLEHLLMDIQDVRGRINSAFFADIFLMLASSPLSNATATEIAERHEEKLIMLGPVLERLHDELLSPLIDMTFDRMAEAGILPPPPPELEGMPLKVEFVSVLAQAQKAVRTNAVDRYVGALGAVANLKPAVLDKFDADAWADNYADDLGIDPELIVADDIVAQTRAQRAQAQAQANAMAAAAQQAETASMAAGAAAAAASPGAMDILGNLTGYDSPQPRMM